MTQRVKIFGSPGCGKTETLLNRMEDELRGGTSPSRMAYLTFTVRARKEAVGRVTSRFNIDPDDLPYFRTLHSIAYRQLGVVRAAMVRDDELREFGDLVGETFTSHRRRADYDDGIPMFGGGKRGDRLLAFDHRRRHRMEDIETAYRGWEDIDDYRVVERFCAAYRTWKKREDLVDFTDLLEQVEDPLPVDAVFVDEAQDLSRRQWEALDVFSSRAERVYIAGDDDQAIFTWAGADPHELVNREGEVQVLEHSHRLSRAVFSLSQDLVRRISNRQKKSVRPRDKKGRVDLAMDFDFVDIDPNVDTLILYRNHYLSQDIEARLLRLGLPFSRSGGRSSPGSLWGPAIFYWERLRKGRTLRPVQVKGIADAMTRDGMVLAPYGRARLGRLSDGRYALDDLVKEGIFKRVDEPWFTALDRIPEAEIEYLRRVIQHHGSASLLAEPNIRLSTIHAAKGAEADRVILLTSVSRKVRETMYRDPDSELRVFYVGVTRARDHLTLVGVDNPFFDTRAT